MMSTVHSYIQLAALLTSSIAVHTYYTYIYIILTSYTYLQSTVPYTAVIISLLDLVGLNLEQSAKPCIEREREGPVQELAMVVP